MLIFGAVFALVCAELILNYVEWAPGSLGSRDGLRISFCSDTLYQNEHTSHLEVDREIGRQTGAEKAPVKELPQILFYGDSMTFGAGVKAEETFPFYVQSELGKETVVRNLGVIGFGPDQSTKLALRSTPQGRSTIGILTLFPGNDFRDLLTNKLISCRETDCEWNTAHILSPFLSQYRLVNLIRSGLMGKNAIPSSVITELFNDSEANYDTLSVSDRHLAEEQLSFALAEFAHIFSRERTLIVVIPPFSSLQNPTERTTESLKVAISITSRMGLKMVAMNEQLLPSSYLPQDHHLSSEGHQRVSAALVPEIKKILHTIHR